MNSICFKALFGAFCFVTLLVSCETDTTAVVGENWINNGTKVFYIDTFTVATSTYKFDSIVTGNTSRYLLGGYTDPIFGHVKASPYFQLYSYEYYLDTEAKFDSVALLLDYSGYYYNDTIPKQTLNVFEVLETITPTEDYFYNTSSFKTNPEHIGELTFSPTPKSSDSIHIPLNSDFGKNLFQAIQDKDISSLDELTQQYQGIMLEADDANTTVLGIGTSSKLRLYYSIKNEVETETYYYDLSINTSNSFHNISTNYNNTHFKSLVEQTDEVASKIADNLSFIQAGSGLVTKVNIPYLERIYTINGSGSIMDANLKISLKQNSNTKNLTIRDSLNIYLIDQTLAISTQLTDYSGTSVYGIKSVNEFDSDIITYNIPVKYFVDLKLNAVNASNLALGITSQGFNESVDRYVLEGEASTENDLKTTLELTYALYDDE
ncbi:DUF4270 family protein [Formosa haliotis]|uniref:DUF4270 family protein n=1 Tax=Formosa haliotis TaxID=1555194 RepID=UPI000824801D|nr:DUF4270 family protein [Formosa haliotis]